MNHYLDETEQPWEIQADDNRINDLLTDGSKPLVPEEEKPF